MVNLLLTVALVWLFGPVGGAVASLFAVVLSHWFLLPRILLKEFGEPLATVIRNDGLFATGLGLLAAAVPCGALSSLRPSVGRIVLGAVLGLMTAGALGAFLLGHKGRRRLMRMLAQARVS